MDQPTGMAGRLREFVTGLGQQTTAPLDGSLTELENGVRAVVASYRGMRLTLAQDGWPITLAAFDAGVVGTITASLRIPMTLILGGAADGRVTFYAQAPGAFVDLGADLGYSLSSIDILLDVDLDDGPPVSGLFGLDGLAAINRAVGVLIDQGADPTDARAILRRQARAAGQTTDRYAAGILEP